MKTKIVPITSNKPNARLARREAQRLINELAKDSSNVRYSRHAKERMIRGFTYNSMLTILREGFIVDEPEKRKGRWCYKIIFHKLKGNRDGGCVVDIREDNKLKVITVMWIDI